MRSEKGEPSDATHVCQVRGQGRATRAVQDKSMGVAAWLTKSVPTLPEPSQGQAHGTSRRTCVALWVRPTSEILSRDKPVLGRTFGIRNAAPRASGRSCTCGVRSIGRDGLCTAVAEKSLSCLRLFSGMSRSMVDVNAHAARTFLRSANHRKQESASRRRCACRRWPFPRATHLLTSVPGSP